MKNKFLIGEMSKLHNTPVKTLRYYDEIGLFKPIEIDESNGYRYYSTDQFEQLNTINYLKALGVSLKEIKEQLEKRDMDSFIQLLTKEREAADRHIKRLERIRDTFDKRITEIQQARNIGESQIDSVHFKHIERRCILRLHNRFASEPELELNLRQLENGSTRVSSIFIGGVGLTIAQSDLVKHKFNEYNSIFILLEQEIETSELLDHFPGGEYACVYYRGTHQDSPKYYRMLLTEIEKQGAEIIGDAIERTVIDAYISNNKEDHLNELQIPIRYEQFRDITT
ncbi:MerR family transcriptional regulator [Paenibacillus sp. N1-5-1-14]|uniref:MerR family transcriptional regulator n=1 Tax=Paenibacillus radicibacter TaxID=2972488 RepID=UPI00215943F4|nr:MerR family transcriptional regulator [Paenibacillus radicibacter]MCR8643239.1 MerR family transcriptional regulator [Paenibacillus radicibacter]